MQNLVTKFMEHKSSGKKVGFRQYPISYTNEEDRYFEGFVQDIKITQEKYDDDKILHRLTIVILNQNNREVHTLFRECIAPNHCKIDWENLYCLPGMIL